MQRDFLSSSSPQQYRMRRLQVFNWGTFSDLHDIPIAEEGFLFVGRSGSGKSTLLDALSALLVPPLWMGFNAAAREGDKGRHDRNLVSYIRGAWADQKDTDSGEIATQYLRPATTWTALSVEYANPSGQHVSLVQLFWLRGSTNRNTDVKRHFIIAERPFDIAQEFQNFPKDLDIRSLKQKLIDVRHFDTFSAYSDRFRQLLEIEQEMALKLLHKTQSAKNLGDLNGFLREFMLDRPQTFEVAEQLVKEFAELDAAHQAVVAAREQVNTLQPSRDAYQRLLAVKAQVIELDQLLGGVDAYRDRCKIKLLKEEIQHHHTQDQGLEGLEGQQQEALDTHKAQLKSLEEQHREQGGARIEELEQQKDACERQRDERLEKRKQADTACKKLGWVLADSPQSFAESVAQARGILEGWRESSEQIDEKRFSFRSRKQEAENEFVDVRKRVEVMQRQPSNIRIELLDLRRQLTAAIGLSEVDLPFVGELIEVKTEESEWRGAIERLLHGFALSLLVDEDHYAAVSNYVNETRLHNRIVYYRVTTEAGSRRLPTQANSVIAKLTLKDDVYAPWLDSELRRRFDYACVESMKDFRQIDRALTRQGQVRHGKSRHEKDDRHAIDDRLNWVLGFDNRDKMRLYQEQAQRLAAEISQLDHNLAQLKGETERQQERILACQTLTNIQWQEIDVVAMLDRIQMLTKTLAEMRSAAPALKELGDRIQQEKDRLQSAEGALNRTRAGRISIGELIKQRLSELREVDVQIADPPLSDYQQQALSVHFNALGTPLTLKNLELHRASVERGINKEQKILREEQGDLERTIEKCFGKFKRTWPLEGADLDETLASAADFMALLERLEHDGLPKYEQRFFDMLKEQSIENLAALNRHLADARKEIRERVEMVNESLAQAEFNPGTHLKIDSSDRILGDVKTFREQVKQVLENSWLMDQEGAEARFTVLRDMVSKLGSAESENQRWRELVLDVRQHVEFIGHEFDATGQQVEVYRSGAGKSGGQREKLATTCLAAALRYQLGGSEGGVPLYASVVLDEAFIKTDNEFTDLSMKIFTTFGFQLIVATPLKSVMTLEPFIGGACFVDIKERKHSATLQIEYDQQRRRLNLPEKMHGEVVAD